MFDNMENLEIINVLYGVSSLNKQFSNRAYHALIFKIDGESVYSFGSKKIALAQGNVLFIPKGESYSVTQTSSGESHYALINFMAALPNPAPRLYNCNKFNDFKYFIDKMISLSCFDDYSTRFEVLSLFYKIISVLYQKNRKEYCDLNKRNTIKPAIDYLAKNIFNIDLKVGKLHVLCNVSDTYFRKIFMSIYGVSPKKYVQQKRLVQAKNILDSGEYTHVYEVARIVGFSDALYFSKLFKNMYGYAPSKDEKFF